MTPEEFKEKMLAIAKSCSGDPEKMHAKADDLLVEVLDGFGLLGWDHRISANG